MLQQTTVGAVRPRYDAFLTRFPDIASLARTRPETVLAAWSGLGYYARARNLHEAARHILRDHAGNLPRDPAALRALPGFGDYMAAAVACLAFGARIPPVDANVTRVLSRLFAIDGLAGTRAHSEQVRVHAAALLAQGRPGDVTTALMDLGQLLCRPRDPDCGACPLSAACAARRTGTVASFPRKKPRPAIRRVYVAAACAVQRGSALLLRHDDSLLRGLWQFPAAEGATPAAAARRLQGELARLDFAIDRRCPPAVTHHTIVHRRLEIRVFRAIPSPRSKSKSRASGSVRWLTPGQLQTAAIPTLTRRIAIAAGFLPSARRPDKGAAP